MKRLGSGSDKRKLVDGRQEKGQIGAKGGLEGREH